MDDDIDDELDDDTIGLADLAVLDERHPPKWTR